MHHEENPSGGAHTEGGENAGAKLHTAQDAANGGRGSARIHPSRARRPESRAAPRHTRPGPPYGTIGVSVTVSRPASGWARTSAVQA
ncbi:hypothetical protein GCM10017688_54440 [Streptomyces ramulosus]